MGRVSAVADRKCQEKSEENPTACNSELRRADYRLG